MDFRSALRRLPRHGLDGLILLTLLFGLLLSVARHLPAALLHLDHSSESGAAWGVWALYGGAFALAWWIATRPRPLPVVPFILAYLVAVAALHGTYLDWVRPELQSDFRDMWAYAQAFVVSDGLPTPLRFEAQRALPVWTPLVALFGASPWVYKVANVFFLVAASLLFYDLARRWFGHAVGQALLLLFALGPEPYFAAATTSHDVSGLFFCACAFWLAASLWERIDRKSHWAVLVGTAIALAGVLGLLQVQRGVSSFLLLAMTAVVIADAWTSGVAKWRTAVLRLVLLLVIPYALMTAGLSGLSARGVLLSEDFQEEFFGRSFASFSGSLSPGTFQSHGPFRLHFLRPLDLDELADLGRHLFLSDLYYNAPEHRPTNVLERAKRLFALGSQEHHYYEVLSGDSPLSSEQVAPALRVLNDVAVLWFSVMGAIAAAGFALVLRPPWISALPIVYLGGLIAGLLLFGENQPRYLFPIWLVLPAMIAVAFSRLGSEWTTLGAVGVARAAGSRAIGALLVVVVPIAAFFGVVRATYDVADGRVIGEWEAVGSSSAVSPGELESRFATSQLGVEPGAAGRAFGSLVTTLRLDEPPQAGDWVEVRRSVCGLDPDRSALGFYLYWGAVRKELADAFDFSVRLDGGDAYVNRIGRARSVTRVRIGDVFGKAPCAALALRVTANRAATEEGWQRASTAHIYFPRLVP